MLNVGRIRFASPKEIRIQLDKFNLGVNKLLRDTRLRAAEAAQATNLMLVQDGLWTPRWGTAYYGGDTGGSQIDGFSEYIKSDNTRELIVVAAGKVWKKSGNSWVEVTGATFTAGQKCFFLQIADRLYIANGVDTLAYYDGSTLTTFTELSAPTNVVLTRGSGLSAGSYTCYYQVTALNDIGETTGSTEVSITVDKERDEWSSASNEYIDISWDAVTGATRYQIYYSDESGYEVLLGYSTTNSYRDDNSDTPNPYIEVPDDNTTGAPKFTYMWLSGNRLWATGDPDNRYRVYFSGTGQYIGTFSDFYGGGWIDLEKGGRHQPLAGVHYHDGQGRGRSTVLCNTPEGQGSIWQIGLVDVTVGDDTFTVPSASKVVGSVGTVAPRSVVNVGNDVWFIRGGKNPGVFILGNEPNYWGILRTNEFSVKVRPFFQGLSQANLEDACAYYYEGKVFFSIPTGDSGNDRIIYCDRERSIREPVWSDEWTIGVTQFGEFTDSDGKTHFLGGMTNDGYLIEFSENFQGDLGAAFQTIYLSPRIAVNKDWTKFAKIEKSTIKLGYPVGAINFSVLGTQKGKAYSTLVSKTYVPGVSTTGWNWDKWNTIRWNTSSGSPSTFAAAADIRYAKVKKRLRDIQFRITTNSLDAKYTLLGLQAKGRPIETAEPSDWKLS